MKVIVAGGGLAGLTAARALSRDGASVTVLEARERLGGRVCTVHLGESQHGELGGEFIDAEHEAIRGLCDELALPLVRVLRSGFTHRFRGSDGDFHVSRTRPWTELEKLAAPLLREYRSAGGNPESDAVREMATFSLRAWLRRQHATPEQHAMADALRGFFLADPDDLSVVAVVEQLASSAGRSATADRPASTGSSGREVARPAQAEMYRVEGGNDRIVDALARESRAAILLRHRITSFAQATDRVIVTAIDGHGLQQQLEADAALITMPASTLADVAFTPALPDNQWRALRALQYGRATKVIVQSPRDAFRGRARAFATDTPLGAFWDGTEGQRPTSNSQLSTNSVLTFLAGASASPALQARAARGPHALLSDLCWLGMAGAPVDAMHTTTWEDDPFARGGYAYADPGFDPAWRALLAQRAGRFVFAGEHTSKRWQGYMEGAVESGLRAAREVTSVRGSKITT